MSSNKRALRQLDNEGSFGFKNKFFHFQGETLDGKPHGPGLLRLSNGVTVQGEFVKGELKGPGTKRWPDGSIFYGSFENGEPHGFGRHFSVQTLQDFEGFYERGYKKGYGKLTDHAQETVFEGEFLRDFPNGKGVLKSIGGELVSPLCVKGYWENGKLHGLAMATMANGDTAVGVCEDGLWTGNGAFATLSTPFAFSIEAAQEANLKSLTEETTMGGFPPSTPPPPPTSSRIRQPAAIVNPSQDPNSLANAARLLRTRTAIRYKGPMEHGCRAEIPDALKLRSVVLLCNRAPLERVSPDTPPGEHGLYLWGNKAPQSPLSATSRRGVKSPRGASSPNGRVGALPPVPNSGRGGASSAKGIASPRIGVKGAAGDGKEKAAESTLLYKAPCAKPLRLQVSLAKKTYRTHLVDPNDPHVGEGDGIGGGGGRNNIMPFLGAGGRTNSTVSGVSSYGIHAGRTSSVSSVSTSVATGGRANTKMTKGVPVPSSSRAIGGRGDTQSKLKAGRQRRGVRRGKDDNSDDEDYNEEGSNIPLVVTEEVITAQKSESGRRLFARLYNIRTYMQHLQQSAEAWSAALAREERHRRRRAEGLPSDTEEDDDTEGESGDSSSDEGNAEEEDEEGDEEDALSEIRNDTGDEGGDDGVAKLGSDSDTPSTMPRAGQISFKDKSGRRRSSRATSGTREDSSFSQKPAANSATPRSQRKSGKKKSGEEGATKGDGKAKSSSSLNERRKTSPKDKQKTSSSIGRPRSGSPNATRQAPLSAAPPQTHAEKLASLIRYLSPANFIEAIAGKPLPPGVFECPLGVGGTPAKGTPRARGGHSQQSPPLSPLPQPDAKTPQPQLGTPRRQTTANTAPFSQPTSPRRGKRAAAAANTTEPNTDGNAAPNSESLIGDTNSNVVVGSTLQVSNNNNNNSNKCTTAVGNSKSLRPLITDPATEVLLPESLASTAEGHATAHHLSAAITAFRRQLDTFSFPTAEELSGVCSDGTTSFEFFLPIEGEYLLEIFVSDLVQLSPGDESRCVVLAASTFAPFVATAEEDEVDRELESQNAGGGAGSNTEDFDDDHDGGDEGSADDDEGMGS